jgi:hypothetical protein
MDRIEEVRAAATEYGKRSVENMRMGEKLGREIMTAFDKYLTPSGGLITGVPPVGDWSPDSGDYRGAAFSYYHTPNGAGYSIRYECSRVRPSLGAVDR